MMLRLLQVLCSLSFLNILFCPGMLMTLGCGKIIVLIMRQGEKVFLESISCMYSSTETHVHSAMTLKSLDYKSNHQNGIARCLILSSFKLSFCAK